MRVKKAKTDKQLSVERIHHSRSYKLAVNRESCAGCEFCSLVCPREAISLEKQPKIKGEKAKHPTIDVDETKCHYCGICTAICPLGAVQVTIDGENIASVIEKESFPQLIRQITTDSTKCPADGTDCEDACPLGLIKVKSNSKTGTVTLQVDEAKCPCCGLCEVKCPEGAVKIRRIFTGKLGINHEKCPEGCRDCLDGCPITGALYLSEKDGKVHTNELFCIYCGVCRAVCPEEGALELSRSTIRHTPVRSGAWNKALEKLTSTTEMVKELRGKGRKRTMEAIKKRLGP
ncbi:MAG: 4Fe-4S dicluster domain-containing protein, partial [Candidatus Bathyarchaeota archaeon]|nr:4Fe-4S dicluster domain-containing protein [Candidatus Bathyarchaeota archaeon]